VHHRGVYPEGISEIRPNDATARGILPFGHSPFRLPLRWELKSRDSSRHSAVISPITSTTPWTARLPTAANSKLAPHLLPNVQLSPEVDP
jgi:hypothetical protein